MKTIIFALVTMFIAATNVSADSVFQPEGCEYSVSFPGEPEIGVIYVPDAGEIQSARYAFTEKITILRAECVPVQLKQLDVAEIAKDMIVRYAEHNGLQHAQYEFRNDELGYIAKVRGFKTIDGEHVTYQIQEYFGTRSFMTLYMGGPSSTFPAGEIGHFVESVKR